MPDDGRQIKVSAEFKGLARSFVGRIDVAAKAAKRSQESAARYVEVLQQRRVGRWHRPEHLLEIERRWMTQPTAGALLPPWADHKPHALALRAIRMLGATSIKPDWSTHELAVMVAQCC